jgi:hypothetical protein
MLDRGVLPVYVKLGANLLSIHGGRNTFCRNWKYTTSRETGTQDDQEKAQNDGCVQWLAEQDHAEQDRDSWIDVCNHGGPTGSDLAYQGKE